MAPVETEATSRRQACIEHTALGRNPKISRSSRWEVDLHFALQSTSVSVRS